MKEIKVKVTRNNENKVLSIEPLNKATGKEVDTEIMIARLLSEDDIDRELKTTGRLMQEGINTYHKVHGRIRQKS